MDKLTIAQVPALFFGAPGKPHHTLIAFLVFAVGLFSGGHWLTHAFLILLSLQFFAMISGLACSDYGKSWGRMSMLFAALKAVNAPLSESNRRDILRINV
jgi:hypothetical protein